MSHYYDVSQLFLQSQLVNLNSSFSSSSPKVRVIWVEILPAWLHAGLCLWSTEGLRQPSWMTLLFHCCLGASQTQI